jgi:hypothetical protein
MKKRKLPRKAFEKDGVVIVFSFATTPNPKLSTSGRAIVQTYTYSKEQIDYVKKCMDTNEKVDHPTFYKLANANCMDCPFRDYRKCYTHKGKQTLGFITQIKFLIRENYIEPMPKEIPKEILKWCKWSYVRFGTYGEPTKIPLDWVVKMASASFNFTGYTHQWRNAKGYEKYFMASTHSKLETKLASECGYRSFMTTNDLSFKDKNFINCPASKEKGRKTSCEDCGLCKGVSHSSKRNVVIVEH